jgi:rod shape-determining protein MreD
MMTAVIMAVFLIGAAALQAALPAVTWLGQARLPLLPAVALYFALHRRAGTALVAAFLAGFLQDVLSPIHLGYSSACLCAIGIVANRFRTFVIADSAVTPAVFGLLAGILLTPALYVLAVKGNVATYSWDQVVLRSLGQGVAGMAATPLLFGLLRLADGLVGNVRAHEDIGEIDWSI